MSEWQTPLEIVKRMVDDWDTSGELPTPVLDESGHEKLSSRLRRAIVAHAKQRDLDKGNRPAGFDMRFFRQLRHEDELPWMQNYLDQCAARRDQLDGIDTPLPKSVLKGVFAKDIALFNQEQEQAVHADTPRALKAMGLEDQEIGLFGDLGEWPAVVEVRHWVNGKGCFLVLGGPPNTGKTVAAASALLGCREKIITTDGRICQRWTRKGRFTKAAELARMQLYGKEAELEHERLRRVALLVIDDVGAETMTEPWLALFQDLVDERLRRQRRTVLTTNLTWPDFVKRYGERISRRLTSDGVRFRAERPKEGPQVASGTTN